MRTISENVTGRRNSNIVRMVRTTDFDRDANCRRLRRSPTCVSTFRLSAMFLSLQDFLVNDQQHTNPFENHHYFFVLQLPVTVNLDLYSFFIVRLHASRLS